MSEDTYRDMQKVLVALILNDVDLFHLKSQFINKLDFIHVSTIYFAKSLC